MKELQVSSVIYISDDDSHFNIDSINFESDSDIDGDRDQ